MEALGIGPEPTDRALAVLDILGPSHLTLRLAQLVVDTHGKIPVEGKIGADIDLPALRLVAVIEASSMDDQHCGETGPFRDYRGHVEIGHLLAPVWKIGDILLKTDPLGNGRRSRCGLRLFLFLGSRISGRFLLLTLLNSIGGGNSRSILGGCLQCLWGW